MTVKQANYFPLGNLDSLITNTVNAYESILRKTVIKAKIDAVEKEYGIGNPYDPDLATVRNFFAASNLPAHVDFDNAQRMTKGLARMKLVSVANTLDILRTLGLTVAEPITSAQLTEVATHIDWSRVSGINASQVQTEITELKAIEDLK